MHPKDRLQERLSTTSHIGHRGNLHWPENSDRRYPDINYSLVVAQHNNIMVAVSQYERTCIGDDDDVPLSQVVCLLIGSWQVATPP